MKIKIIPPDNRIGVDSVFKTVALDFPEINAIDFDGNTAAIEHREHNGEWLPPATITKEDFFARFGNALLEWESAPDDATARAPSIPVDAVSREDAQRMADEAAAKAVAAFAAEIVKPAGG